MTPNPSPMAKYFTLSELTYSSTATNRGWSNTPTPVALSNLHRLMVYLDEIREAYGAPIRVSSGYRSPRLNKAVGGVPDSQHLYGLAADLVTEDLPRLFQVIQNLGGFDRLIWEHPRRGQWVHVSIAPTDRAPRGQVLDYNGYGYKSKK